MRVVHPIRKAFHIGDVDYGIDRSHQIEFLVQIVDLRGFERVGHVLIHRLADQIPRLVPRHGQRAHAHDVAHGRSLSAVVARSHHALHPYLEPRKDFVFEVDTSGPALVLVVHDITQLVGISGRNEVGGTVRRTPDAQVVGLDMARLRRGIPPVEVGSVLESLDVGLSDPGRRDVEIGIVLRIVGGKVGLVPEGVTNPAQELFPIQRLEPVCRSLDRIGGRIGNDRFARFVGSGHRRDQNHTVGGTRSVHGGGTGVLQHVDRLDVRRVQIHQIPLVDDTVDHQKRRRIAAVEGVLTAYGNTGIRTGRSDLPDIQTRD